MFCGTRRQDWRVGPFAACSLQQRGCVGAFSSFRVTKRQSSVHEAEGIDFGDPGK